MSAIRAQSEGQIREFAVDVVVHDNLARFGVTGIANEGEQATEAGAGAKDVTFLSPEDAGMSAAAASTLTPNPMMSSGTLLSGLPVGELPPAVISADDVEAGPGARWAATVQVGDQILAQFPAAEEELLYYCPDSAKQVVLVADPAGLPAVEQLVNAEREAGTGRKLIVIGQVPHKADRRVLAGAEVFWVLPGMDLVATVAERLNALAETTKIKPVESTLAEKTSAGETDDATDIYIWAALEDSVAARLEQEVLQPCDWCGKKSDVHVFWCSTEVSS
ncbi:hypothetical protein BM477_05590 [Boudabousia marimammalium]|uniref:SIP-like Rossmann fold domain-containing protein n=2 Tax=Boudabousia marimammalium TaxID=156892 RepID=A0A1Q5PM99_9ACTO|nr:hypothetical protein BM477_05590 [Boudabousia marimammalium]